MMIAMAALLSGWRGVFRRAGILLGLVTGGAAGAGPTDSVGEWTLPAVEAGAPAAGRRVAVTPPEYRGTAVHHTVWLPEDWTPDWRARGRTWPVIVEYTGNFHPASGSTGKVADAGLGFALARGRGIWVVLPYVAAGGRENAVTWWGDVGATVRYATANVPRICAELGGDARRVVLCGFSRGAIGVGLLGLHDEDVSGLWCGFYAHDHFDGAREWRGTAWGSPLDRYRAEAGVRLQRLRGRPLLVTEGGTGMGTPEYLTARLPAEAWTYLRVDMNRLYGGFPNAAVKSAHTDRWLLRPGPERDAVMRWLDGVLASGRE
jgi:hypothetical protein